MFCFGLLMFRGFPEIPLPNTGFRHCNPTFLPTKCICAHAADKKCQSQLAPNIFGEERRKSGVFSCTMKCKPMPEAYWTFLRLYDCAN